MMLSILYEDADLIFIDKPADVVVQRGYDADERVLLEEVDAYARGKGERAILMQRLDRGTTGVLFFSKAADINRNLTRQFEKKTIRKTYLALAEGRVAQAQWIDAPLLRIGPISFGVRPEGKRSVTRIDPLASSATGSFLRIGLLTGRTHQIRVHLAAIGHPLVGDWLYGERNAPRPMLHAQALAMRHPRTNQPLVVEAPVPPDFMEACRERNIELP